MKQKTVKKPTKKVTRTAKKEIEELNFSESPSYEEPTVMEPPKRAYPIWAIVAIVLGLGILALIALNKGWLFAAVVNGQPVFRWDLNNVLTKRYGQQTLEALITEKLISDEAQKQGLSVSNEEVDNRGKEILASFGSNITIEDFLKFQGMSRADFDNQIRLQVMVQKLLTKDMSLSDDDINKYIASNRAVLVSTDAAKLKDEAKNAMIESTVNSKLEEFLKQIKDKASVQRFL